MENIDIENKAIEATEEEKVNESEKMVPQSVVNKIDKKNKEKIKELQEEVARLQESKKQEANNIIEKNEELNNDSELIKKILAEKEQEKLENEKIKKQLEFLANRETERIKNEKKQNILNSLANKNIDLNKTEKYLNTVENLDNVNLDLINEFFSKNTLSQELEKNTNKSVYDSLEEEYKSKFKK